MLFGKRESISQTEQLFDVTIAFRKRKSSYVYTEEEQAKLAAIKRRCSCEKDPNFKFGCKHAISWFAQAVLSAKLKRKLKQSGLAD